MGFYRKADFPCRNLAGRCLGAAVPNEINDTKQREWGNAKRYPTPALQSRSGSDGRKLLFIREDEGAKTAPRGNGKGIRRMRYRRRGALGSPPSARRGEGKIRQSPAP